MTWPLLLPVIPGVASIVLGGLALLAPKKSIRYAGVLIGLVGVAAAALTLHEQTQAVELERAAVASYGNLLLEDGRFKEAYDLLAEWSARFADDCALTVGLGKAALGLLEPYESASLEDCERDALFGWQATLLGAQLAFATSDRGQHAINQYRASLGRLAEDMPGQEPTDQVLCLSELAEVSWETPREMDRRIAEIESLVESYGLSRANLYRLRAIRAKHAQDMDGAIGYFMEATTAARNSFDRRGFALSSFGLAELLARERRTDDARVHYEKAARIFKETDSPRDLHLAQAGQAYLDFLTRDWDSAIKKWQRLAQNLSNSLPIRDRALFWLRYANTYIEGMQAGALENDLQHQRLTAKLLEKARQPLLQWPEESRWRYEGEIETGVAALRALEGNFKGACERFQEILRKDQELVADVDAEIYDHINIVAMCARLPGYEKAVQGSLETITTRLAAEEQEREDSELVGTLRKVRRAAKEYLKTAEPEQPQVQLQGR